MISIEDCTKFYEEYILKNFRLELTYGYYYHDEIDIWMIINIKVSTSMPSYFIFDVNNTMILLTGSPFEAEQFIKNRVRLEKVKKIMT